MTNAPAGSDRTAHETVALSMHTVGASEQAIREATGLTASVGGKWWRGSCRPALGSWVHDAVPSPARPSRR